MLSLAWTNHIPGLVPSPAPTAGQSREPLINLNNNNVPGSPGTFFNRHLSASESESAEPWVVLTQRCWVVLREWSPNEAESPQFPEGSFHSPGVPGAAEVWAWPPVPLPTLCSAPNPWECWGAQGSPTALQVQLIWNYTRHPSPRHPRASVLWEQAYINVHLLQLSFCCFLFTSQLFDSPLPMWFLSFSVPFLPAPWQGGTMHTSPPEPQQKHLEFFTPFPVLWAHQQHFFTQTLAFFLPEIPAAMCI